MAGRWTRSPARVFFPWERRKGLLPRIARARLQGVALVVLGIGAAVLVARREGAASDVRATRTAIANGTRAVLAYRADRGGACPPSMSELVKSGYLRAVPRDAWDHPLRLVCPGRRDAKWFELVSDGPDGEPFGLDRVE